MIKKNMTEESLKYSDDTLKSEKNFIESYKMSIENTKLDVHEDGLHKSELIVSLRYNITFPIDKPPSLRNYVIKTIGD